MTTMAGTGRIYCLKPGAPRAKDSGTSSRLWQMKITKCFATRHFGYRSLMFTAASATGHPDIFQDLEYVRCCRLLANVIAPINDSDHRAIGSSVE
jgi:hypothetical protein